MSNENEGYPGIAHDLETLKLALIMAEAALRNAERLAWEVGCESEDGVMTLLDDSRGDLYREVSAARDQAGAALAQIKA